MLIKIAIVRHDYYQTSTSVIASLYLRKVDKQNAKIDFTSSSTIALDLPTTDMKRYREEMALFGQIDIAKSTYKIQSTKVELMLVKLYNESWPLLKSDDTNRDLARHDEIDCLIKS